jgi:hypothetical protein
VLCQTEYIHFLALDENLPNVGKNALDAVSRSPFINGILKMVRVTETANKDDQLFSLSTSATPV